MRYAEYRPTGTTWVERVPATWDCKKISALFLQRKTKVSDADYPALSVTKIGVVPQLTNAAKSNDGENRKLVCIGDFVINSRSDRKGSCGVSRLDGSVSLINLVLTPYREWNNRYVHYMLRSHAFSEEYYRYGRGIVADLWTTRYSEMKSILLPVPPREEQDQIVRYLDWQVSKVNKLIAAKKKQIKLLQEQKQAMINAAVTQGGEAWKEISLGNLGSFRKGYGGTRADDTEEGVACIRYGDIYRTGVYVLESPVTRIDAVAAKTYARIYKSEVIFPLSGETKEDIGMAMVNHISEDTWCSGDCAVFTSNGKILPEFLAYAVRCPYIVQQRASMAKGDIIVHLSTNAIRRLRILVPPVDVQGIIVTKIKAMQSKTDRILSVIEQQLSFLQEFRTRLISDVVTGKLDVRDVVVPDCESVEEDASEVKFADDELGISEAEEP